jgi:hypothetical protein
LYFATRALGYKNYTLIFDIRVASSLVLLSTHKEVFEIVTVTPSSRYNDFEKYNSLMFKVAKKNKIAPENLEMYLFNQVFSN